MTADAFGGHRTTGLSSPVALYGAAVLLLASPLFRGGNRGPAVLALELLSIVVLGALMLRQAPPGQALSRPALLLALTPVLIAIVQLTPLPPAVWGAMAGRELYLQTLPAAGAAADGWRPLSLVPDATAVSLLAGLPLLCAFLMGHRASLRDLRFLLRLVVFGAAVQVVLALLQAAGGERSPLFFGVPGMRPVGTFANANHLANYLAMALCALVWLAYEDIARARRNLRQRNAVRVAVAVLLVVGLLLTRSRGGFLLALPPAALAFGLVYLSVSRHRRAWQFAIALALVLLAGGGALVGWETLTSRASATEFATSAGFRGMLASTTFEGALALWPWGSGWGTYPFVYPRFQPAEVGGFANHAHMDYVELLFEGGALFVLVALALAWAVVRRFRILVSAMKTGETDDRSRMACAVCGLGLLGFLLHSLVEFNMRIPANAILAALLAGVYLRPLASGSRGT